MKILFITTNRYLPQFVGGTESNLNALCCECIRLNKQVIVISGIKRKSIFAVKRALVNIFTFKGYSSSDRICGYPVFRFSNIGDALRRCINIINPDIAVTHLGHAVDYANEIVKLGIPTVVSLHNADFEKLGDLNKVDDRVRFISNSVYTSGRFLHETGKKSTVIYNMIIPEMFMVKNTGRKVTFINPHRIKGMEIAFALAEKMPKIPFLFVGSHSIPDKEKNNFIREVKRLGNIEWRRSMLDMRETYKDTRLLIVPSKYDETWGRVASEAQVSGIPVLASNRGGLPEAVGPGGILLPDDDIGAWQAALNDVWYDRQRWQELSSRALQYAARPEMQPAAVVEQFLKVLISCREEF